MAPTHGAFHAPVSPAPSSSTPPRTWEQKLAGQRGELPYESMSEEDILGLPVAEAAADDWLLLLWPTNSHIPLALRCVERWGFAYRVLMTWGKVTKDEKPHIGLGYWLRGAGIPSL